MGYRALALDGAHYQIYNAIYMGEAKAENLYDEISPVNNFRVIFNNAFGANFDLLPDEAYIIDQKAGTATQFTGGFKCP